MKGMRRLFLTAALLILLLPMVALGGLFLGSVGLTSGAVEAASAEVEQLEGEVMGLLAARWEDLSADPAKVRKALAELGEGESFVLEVQDLEGRVLLASDGVVDGEFSRKGFVITPTRRILLIHGGQQTTGILQLWIWPPAAIRWVSRSALVALWAGTLTLVALLLWLLRSIGRQILQPLQELERATAAIAAGDLDVSVPSSTVLELNGLSAGFGTMRDQLKAALQRQQALEEERRQFIAAIGHDLRTPLSSVRAFAEGLRDGLARDPAKATRYGQVILEKAQELQRLVDGLFDYARLGLPTLKVELAQVDAQEYLTAVVHAFQPRAAERAISLTASGPPLALHIDPDLFIRALNNLLDNGLRHTTAGGSVTVRWGAEERSHRSAEPETKIWLEVADTGEGIPPEMLAHLFSPLHRADVYHSRRRGGAGLGLAIAARIVSAHGGRIECESQVGQGTQFRIYLP